MRINVTLCRLFLAVFVLGMLMTGAAMAATDAFTFTLNAGGDGYVVTGYSGSESTVTVPDWYNSLPVTEIGSAAFQGNTAIKTVKLPSTIEKLGSSAFKGCTNLATVTDYTAASQPPAEDVAGDADSNGTVNAADVLRVMQYDAGWSVSVSNADVTNDGSVDLKDAVKILQYCAEQISTLE